MPDTAITLIGNLVENPVLRITPSGVSVCGFRLASTPRRFDRAEQRFVDGNTLYLRVSCWRQLAENVAASLSRGDRALVVGRLRQNNYETQDGDRRVSYEVDADAVAAELTWRPVEVRRTTRSSSLPADSPAHGDPLADAAASEGDPFGDDRPSFNGEPDALPGETDGLAVGPDGGEATHSPLESPRNGPRPAGQGFAQHATGEPFDPFDFPLSTDEFATGSRSAGGESLGASTPAVDVQRRSGRDDTHSDGPDGGGTGTRAGDESRRDESRRDESRRNEMRTGEPRGGDEPNDDGSAAEQVRGGRVIFLPEFSTRAWPRQGRRSSGGAMPLTTLSGRRAEAPIGLADVVGEARLLGLGHRVDRPRRDPR